MQNFFFSLDFTTLFALAAALFFVLFYEAINGFHDTANAVATVIYTRSMNEKFAVVMAGVCNFSGVVLGGLSVAYAIVHLLPIDIILNASSKVGTTMIFSILFAAIIWNLLTWYFGIPSSSSHTLIGAIIGVALSHAIFTHSSLITALNVPKTIQIFSSLFISPFIGLSVAGILIYLLRRFHSKNKKQRRIHMSPSERLKKYGKKKPPFWIRTGLILSGAGVSFSHGANDGQKGIGLLMLALICIAPTQFVINMNANEYDISKTKSALIQLQKFYSQPEGQRIFEHFTPTQNMLSTEIPEDEKYTCEMQLPLKLIGSINPIFYEVSNYHELSSNDKSNLRSTLLCLAETISFSQKSKLISEQDRQMLTKIKKDLLKTIEYAPIWIIFSVALALGIGTTVGWKRVAVTIGEKIGNSEMTYAQGLATQITAALSIGVASFTGMPVSTTHVLSSAVAGTMVVDGGGVQKKTIKTIAMTWILTLPVSIILSGSIFALALFIF